VCAAHDQSCVLQLFYLPAAPGACVDPGTSRTAGKHVTTRALLCRVHDCEITSYQQKHYKACSLAQFVLLLTNRALTFTFQSFFTQPSFS